MYNIVFEGITAVKNGTKNPAYNAYFKSDLSKPFVDEVLVNITTGSSHLIRNLGGANLTENPNIVCASGPGEITVTTDKNTLDPFVEFCVKNATSPSMYIRSTKYIMLCPSFFEYSVAPNRFQPNCPTTDNSHGWYDQSDWLDYVGFQPYFLIHEVSQTP